jgi:hypothetical protein
VLVIARAQLAVVGALLRPRLLLALATRVVPRESLLPGQVRLVVVKALVLAGKFECLGEWSTADIC